MDQRPTLGSGTGGPVLAHRAEDVAAGFVGFAIVTHGDVSFVFEEMYQLSSQFVLSGYVYGTLLFLQYSAA